MNFTTEISYEVDKNIWDNTLKLNPASTAFQIADFYRPHQLTHQSKPVFITISDPSGKIVGQLSGVIHLTDYWLEMNTISRMITSKFNLGSTLRWVHGPIIHDPDNTTEILSNILSALDKVAMNNDVNLIRGTSVPQMESLPVDIFKKNGYSIEPWITYITDLQRKIDNIFNSLHNKTRYDVRKGEKQGLEFEVVSKRESFDLYLDVKYHDKKKVDKLKKLNKTFFENIWNILFQNGFEKMFIVRSEGKPKSIILNFLFNRNVSQTGVANSPISNYAGSFLTWNTIRWSAKNNYRTFDVGGANPFPTSKKEQGINQFKSKWASKKVDYFLCTKVFNKTKWRISKGLNQPSRLPKKFFRII